MIEQIIEPERDEATSEDWENLIRRTIFQGGGFIRLMLRNLNTEDKPAITKGSRLEINGAFYLVKHEDEEISGACDANSWIFIYAKPPQELEGESKATFEYRTIMPEWDMDRCGWYNGDARAVAKLFYRADGYYSKVVLDDFEAMYKDNFSVIPNSGGVQVNTNKLKKGAYRAELKGGTGGKGGKGNGTASASPSQPRDPTPVTATFFLDKDETVITKQGLGGGNGKDGVARNFTYNNNNFGVASTGGGGGARGGASWLKTSTQIITAQGTSGTDGTDGTGSNYNGSGGVAARTGNVIEITSNVSIEDHASGYGSPSVSASFQVAQSGSATLTVNGVAGGDVGSANNGYVRLFKLWETIVRT